MSQNGESASWCLGVGHSHQKKGGEDQPEFQTLPHQKKKSTNKPANQSVGSAIIGLANSSFVFIKRGTVTQ